MKHLKYYFLNIRSNIREEKAIKQKDKYIDLHILHQIILGVRLRISLVK